jgi:V8-like Glu-specific endopeptidase
MKNLVKNILLASAALLILPLLSLAEEAKSIYGADSRKEYFQLDAAQKALADSTVSFWKSASVTAEGSGFKLKTVNFGDRLNLCPDAKYREQPIGAFCSGSLVGEDLVMTAGHCIKTDAQCLDTKIAFDFNIRSEGGAAAATQPAANIFSCKKVVKRFLAGEPNSANPTGQNLGADYALIQLDRKVAGRKPLAINRGAKLRNGDGIFVVGHPVGLPLKLADDARVRDFSKVGYFVADLDTFGGNSGSPVFNARTRKIEGILVRGDEDFVDSPAGCTAMATYDQTGGRGEDVTKIEVLASFIPRLPGEKAAPEELEVRDVDSSTIQPAEGASRSVSFD